MVVSQFLTYDWCCTITSCLCTSSGVFLKIYFSLCERAIHANLIQLSKIWNHLHQCISTGFWIFSNLHWLVNSNNCIGPATFNLKIAASAETVDKALVTIGWLFGSYVPCDFWMQLCAERLTKGRNSHARLSCNIWGQDAEPFEHVKKKQVLPTSCYDWLWPKLSDDIAWSKPSNARLLQFSTV